MHCKTQIWNIFCHCTLSLSIKEKTKSEFSERAKKYRIGLSQNTGSCSHWLKTQHWTPFRLMNIWKGGGYFISWVLSLFQYQFPIRWRWPWGRWQSQCSNIVNKENLWTHCTYIFNHKLFYFCFWNLILKMIVRMEVKRPFFSWQYVDCQEVKTTAQHGYIIWLKHNLFYVK